MTVSISPEKTGFLLSYCSIAYRDKSALEAAEAIKEAGFSGVEMWNSHIEGMGEEDLAGLAVRCRDLGIRIPVISPYFSFTRGAAIARRSLVTAENAVRAAAILGCKKIRTFVDAGGDGLSSARAGEGDWKSACEGLRQLCAIDPSVEFVLETHENTLADTLPSVIRIFDQVAAPNLKLNFQIVPDFLDRGYLKCLRELFPLVSHMHLQQITASGSHSYIEEPGMVGFGELIAYLRSQDYRGTASVEYCWFPVEAGRCQSAAQLLDKCFLPEIQD